MIRILALLLCATAAWAQSENTSKIIQLKYVQAREFQGIIDTLSIGRVKFSFNIADNAKIVALNGPRETVEAIVDALQKLDVPPASEKNVELTFYMLLAGQQGEAGPIPPEMAGVVKQLQGVFGFKIVRVLETVVMRGREGRSGETNGLMPSTSKLEAPTLYYLRYQRVAISADDKVSRIRLDSLRFGAKVAYPSGGGFGYNEAAISTDVDIREGQKVVIGKSSIDTASQSIFLVVSGKVVD